jgi:hypothetical protein
VSLPTPCNCIRLADALSCALWGVVPFGALLAAVECVLDCWRDHKDLRGRRETSIVLHPGGSDDAGRRRRLLERRRRLRSAADDPDIFDRIPYDRHMEDTHSDCSFHDNAPHGTRNVLPPDEKKIRIAGHLLCCYETAVCRLRLVVAIAKKKVVADLLRTRRSDVPLACVEVGIYWTEVAALPLCEVFSRILELLPENRTKKTEEGGP